MKKFSLLAVVLVFFALASCSTKITRVDTSTVTDLSGRWNDTDSQLVAEEMVKEALSRPWLNNFLKASGREPRVIVGTILNKTDEHISVDTFRKDIERELTNAGNVIFVASKTEREEIREERTDQQEYSSEETRKRFREELGADYMMKGIVTSIPDESGRTKAVYYQIDLELFDLETNVKAWVGQKKIKKIIEKSRFGF